MNIKTPTTKARIASVRIEYKCDADADTDYLGEYSNQKESEHSIERVNASGREYRWFNPCFENYAGCTPAEIAEYCQQDFKRMEALNDGDWHYVGIMAKAVIVSANGITQTIRSGGLWGVESDSGADHLAGIERDELAALREELTALGFGKRAIDFAFKNKQTANL